MQSRIEQLQDQLKGYQGATFKKVYLANLLSSGMRFFEADQEVEAEYCLNKVESLFNSYRNKNHIAAIKTAPATFEKLKEVWREQRIHSAEQVLVKSSHKLSNLENKLYKDKLDSLKAQGLSPKSDVTLLELRKQLYRRVLKSQKISLRKKSRKSEISLIPANPTQAIVGPYNDRYNLGSVLTLMQTADPAWTEEFLDLYRGLYSMHGLIPLETLKGR